VRKRWSLKQSPKVLHRLLSNFGSPITFEIWHDLHFERGHVSVHTQHLYLARKRWSLKQSPKVLHRLRCNCDTTLHSNTRVLLYTWRDGTEPQQCVAGYS
jgi:hypothetical protein